MAKVFVCEKCKCGFYYNIDEGTNKTCVHCQDGIITQLENWESFTCPNCGKEIEVIQLEMMAGGIITYAEDNTDSRLRSRGAIQKGEVDKGEIKCQDCGVILQWVPLDDEDGIMDQEFEEDHEAWEKVLFEKFQEEKEKMQILEAEILSAAGISFKPVISRKRERKQPTISKPHILKPKIVSPAEIDSTAPKVIFAAHKPASSSESPSLIGSESVSTTIGTSAESVSQDDSFNKFLKAAKRAQSHKVPAIASDVKNKSQIISSSDSAPEVKVDSSIISESPNIESISPETGSVEVLGDSNMIEADSISDEGSSIIDLGSETILEGSSEGIVKSTEIVEPTLDEEEVSFDIPQVYSSITGWQQIGSVDLERSAESLLPQTSSPAETIVTGQPAIESLIPEIKLPTPFADEYWQYYYNSEININPHEYMGGNDAVKKILGLLNEVNSHLLNNNIIDITKPLYEEMQSGKLYVVGDTHGSFPDTYKLIKFFVKEIEKIEEINNNNNSKSDIRIVFDGDYVDRNPLDVHNLLFILSFALKYPKYVRLLRGNHEEITINSHYGFLKNINMYFGDNELFDEIQKTFSNLPLMYVLRNDDRKILILHGGLPFFDEDPDEMPEIPDIFSDDFFLDSRFDNIEDMDELSQQILWSDPVMNLPPDVYYLPSRRGIGFNFGKPVFDNWMALNGIDRLIRAHEVFLDGHLEAFDNRLFSLFSCSDYIGRKISAKILEFDFNEEWDKNWKHLTIQEDLN